MKDGFYLIESIRHSERTIIEIDDGKVTWMGGDQLSSVEEMLKDFRVIRKINVDGDE